MNFSDTERIRDGIGYKCALLLQNMSTFIAGIVVGLMVNLYLTLTVLCVAPVIIGLSAGTFKVRVNDFSIT